MVVGKKEKTETEEDSGKRWTESFEEGVKDMELKWRFCEGGSAWVLMVVRGEYIRSDSGGMSIG